MPNPQTRMHTPALAAPVDVTPWRGEQVLTFDGVAISVGPSMGLYWDAPAFLHGYGSRVGQTLSALATAEWQAQGGAGEILFTIGSDDRVVITSTVTPLAIEPSADNEALGFPSAGVPDYLNVHTATGEWARGVVQFSEGVKLSKNGGATVALPHAQSMPRVQSLPTWLRERGAVGDADDVWQDSTLEDLLRSVAGQEGARCVVEAGGHVSVNYAAGGAGLQAHGGTFWRALGGTGRETPAAAPGGRETLTTALPCPAMLAPRYGLAEMRRVTRGRDTRQEMADGSTSSTGLAPVSGWDLTLRIQGPTDGAGELESTLRRFWHEARRGPLTLYPQWGDRSKPGGSMDLRRHVDPWEVFGSGLYSLSVTAEGADPRGVRRGGRLLVALDPADEQARAESYAGDLDVWQEVRLRVLDDPTR